MAAALDGVRVLELLPTRHGAYATRMLADMGALVTVVEPPASSALSRARFEHELDRITFHSRKQSVVLDIERDESRGALGRLAAEADVVVRSVGEETAERLGIDEPALRAFNTRLVYAVCSGFGPRGPLAGAPAADITAQGAGGYMARSGYEGAPPLPAGAAIASATGAMYLCSGILAALVKRERTGEGEQVDVSLYGSQIALQSWEINTESFSGDTAPRAGLGHPLLTSRSVWRSYETADGWLVIGGATTDKFAALCDELGLNDLAERYPDDRSRAAGMLDIHPHLAKAIRTRSTDEWIARFRARDIFCGPVQTYGDILADPQARANGYIATMPHAAFGEALVVGCPIQFGGEPQTEVAPPPELGDSTERYLTELGYSWDEIESLREAGVT